MDREKGGRQRREGDTNGPSWQNGDVPSGERGRMMQKIEELIQFTNTTTNSISRRERGGVVERSVPFPLSPSHCFLSVVPFRALQRGGGGGGRGCNVIPPLKNRFRINRRLPIAVLPCCAVSTPLTA